jgi:hypothetical protein
MTTWSLGAKDMVGLFTPQFDFPWLSFQSSDQM